jgi:predicted LPLAT superfamily acyltransferase
MNAPSHQLHRNPGPSWGFGFLLWAEQWWPRWLFRAGLMAGTWVGLACMRRQRIHSRDYLAVVLGRPATLVEVWRHFFALADSLVFSLRAGRGAPVHCEMAEENAAEFEALLQSGQPALYGSFHFGGSDLLGYLLGERGLHVTIIRLQVDNSTDTRLLGERFAKQISFLWINDPSKLLFDLKSVLDSGRSLALKCDRLEFSAKAEAFHFLGAQRLFPFTIYHLAILFDRPVVFCIAVPEGREFGLRVYSSPVFRPDPAVDRDANRTAAREHFQAVLANLETMVRAHPFLWFNFLPLNPAVASAA